MSALISKPGITLASAGLAIPKDWDAVWFKGLVANLLKGADVRNAIAGPGITITGNISTPYATISAGGPGTVTFTGNVIITSVSGVPLTLNAPPNQPADIQNGGTNTVNTFVKKIISGTAAGFSSGLYIQAGTNASDWALQIRNAANTLNYVQVFGDGGVVIGAATGGDKGVGTVNATGFFINGVALTSGNKTVTGTGAATLSCATMNVGDTFIVWRSGTQTVTNSAALITDAVLQLTSVPVGTYAFEAFTPLVAGTAAAGGRAQITNTAGTVTGDVLITGPSTNQAGTIPSVAAVALVNAFFTHVGGAVVTATATLAVQWAQDVATVGISTIIQPGSFLSITRLI